jgi:hypothetical protein
MRFYTKQHQFYYGRRCAICKSSSMVNGAEQVRHTPNWTLTGTAWYEVLCGSHCVRERGGAHRHYGLDPLAVDWTSAPALELRRGSPLEGGVLPIGAYLSLEAMIAKTSTVFL